MLKNRNIIIFSDDWGRYPSTLQHIVKFFADENKIMWVGSLGLRKPNFSLKDFKRVYEKLQSLIKIPEEKTSQSALDLILVNPVVIPFHDSKIIRKINRKLLVNKLKKEFQRYKFNNVVLITSTPIIGEILNDVPLKSSHYFCLDDYTLFDGAFNSIPFLEEETLKAVNTSFSISKQLSENRVPKTGKSYLLPQGVDVEHFNLNGKDLPAAVMNIKKPIVGFFGLLGEWVDIDLIAQCAEGNPDYSFVIVGPSTVNIDILKNKKNVTCIGEVPYEKLPDYAACFDLGLIPFKISALTISANPLKLLEYFSLGIPVVSTDIPEVSKFGENVYVAKSNSEFISLIGSAVKNYSGEKNEIRRKIAEEHSWKRIAENISEIILESEK